MGFSAAGAADVAERPGGGAGVVARSCVGWRGGTGSRRCDEKWCGAGAGGNDCSQIASSKL